MKLKIQLVSEAYAQPGISSGRVGKTQYIRPKLDKTSRHTYFNLYDTVDAVKRTSCIECDDNLSFDFSTNQMVYVNTLSKSKLVYQLESSEDLLLLQSEYNK